MANARYTDGFGDTNEPAQLVGAIEHLGRSINYVGVGYAEDGHPTLVADLKSGRTVELPGGRGTVQMMGSSAAVRFVAKWATMSGGSRCPVSAWDTREENAALPEADADLSREDWPDPSV